MLNWITHSKLQRCLRIIRIALSNPKIQDNRSATSGVSPRFQDNLPETPGLDSQVNSPETLDFNHSKDYHRFVVFACKRGLKEARVQHCLGIARSAVEEALRDA